MGLLLCVMFTILSQTIAVKFLRNNEQHCLLPSMVDDFICAHSENALLTHTLSVLFSSTSALRLFFFFFFFYTPFGIYIYILISSYVIVILHKNKLSCGHHK